MDGKSSLFPKERQLLSDLRNGVGFLLRKYALSQDRLREVSFERDELQQVVAQKSETIAELEERLAFGGQKDASSSGNPAILRMRKEIDGLILEIDSCLSALDHSIK